MNDSIPSRRDVTPAILGGLSLWIIVMLGLEWSMSLNPDSALVQGSLGRSTGWYLATLAAALLTGVILSVAQSRHRDQRLRSALTMGAQMGIFGVCGVLAAGLSSDTLALAAPRAAILLAAVIGASAVVFSTRRKAPAVSH